MAQLRQSAFFEGPRPSVGETQRGLAMPHGVAGRSKEVITLFDPPIGRRCGHSGRFGSEVGAVVRVERQPESGLVVNINPQVMPFPDVIDLRFPAEEARRREPQLRRRLDRTLPAAAQLEVFLAQPAVSNFFVYASVAGGGFETAALLDRGEKPDTCC